MIALSASPLMNIGIALVVALSGHRAVSQPRDYDGVASPLPLDLNVPAYRLDAYAGSDRILDSLLAPHSATRSFVLTTPIPLRARYEVVEIRDEFLLIHPDVYRRVRNVKDEALAISRLHGYPEWEIDMGSLQETVVRGSRATASARIYDLLDRAPAPAPAIDGSGDYASATEDSRQRVFEEDKRPGGLQ